MARPISVVKSYTVNLTAVPAAFEQKLPAQGYSDRQIFPYFDQRSQEGSKLHVAFYIAFAVFLRIAKYYFTPCRDDVSGQWYLARRPIRLSHRLAGLALVFLASPTNILHTWNSSYMLIPARHMRTHLYGARVFQWPDR